MELPRDGGKNMTYQNGNTTVTLIENQYACCVKVSTLRGIREDVNAKRCRPEEVDEVFLRVAQRVKEGAEASPTCTADYAHKWALLFDE